jgi:hypothetical protein
MMTKSKRMQWADHVACMRGMKCACKVSIGKTETKKTLVGPRHRWEDNNKIEFEDILS